MVEKAQRDIGEDLVERLIVSAVLVIFAIAIGLTFNEPMETILALSIISLSMMLFPLTKDNLTIILLYVSLILYAYGGLIHSFQYNLLALMGIALSILLSIANIPIWGRFTIIGIYYVLLLFSSIQGPSPLMGMLFNFMLLTYMATRAINGPLSGFVDRPHWAIYLLAAVPPVAVLLSYMGVIVMLPVLPSVVTMLVLTLPLVKLPVRDRAVIVALSLTTGLANPQLLLLPLVSLPMFRKVRYHRGVPPPETWVNAWLGGRYYIERVIDSGGFSYVLLGRYGGRRYAIKVLRYTSPSGTPLASNPRVVQSFKREMTNYLLVNSSRVIKVYEIHINEDKLPYRDIESYLEDPPYMVMDYMEYGSLRKYLREVGRLSLNEAVRIGYEVALALKELHEMGILHLDLKPENILFKDKDRRVVMIGDLGASRIYAGQRIEISQFSLAYSAPEVMLNREATEKADIYSLGLILYEMLMGFNPQQYILRGMVPQIGYEIPPQIANIILRSLSIDPRLRPSINEIVETLAQYLPR